MTTRTTLDLVKAALAGKPVAPAQAKSTTQITSRDGGNHGVQIPPDRSGELPPALPPPPYRGRWPVRGKARAYVGCEAPNLATIRKLACAMERTEAVQGAGTRGSIAALLHGWATPLASGAKVDAVAIRGSVSMPSVWGLLARAGWRTRWRHDTVRRGAAWVGRVTGRTPTRRSLPRWRELWARAIGGRKLVSVYEWAAKRGEMLPDWLL